MQQKPNLYKLWSALPPELLSSSSSDEDSTDDNVGRAGYDLMKTSLPLKRVGTGEEELEMEGVIVTVAYATIARLFSLFR